MHIHCFTFGPFETNCYVVSDEQHILLIDPACSNEYERQQLLDYITPLFSLPSRGVGGVYGDGGGLGLSLIATHGHLDHLWGARWATEQWHTPVLMHEADIAMAQAMQQQYDLFGIHAIAESFPISPLSQSFSPPIGGDGGGLGLSLIATPGHTPGSVCLYFPEDKILFSGDTLFRMGYGRTDLPGGNYSQLIRSLQRLFELPSDVRVYPGHGEPTTIGAEQW